jgi:hypothetical protein
LSNKIFHGGKESNLHFAKSFIERRTSVFSDLKGGHFRDCVSDIFGQRFELLAYVVLQLRLVLFATFVEGCGNGAEKKIKSCVSHQILLGYNLAKRNKQSSI